jgi:uncharacterized protein
MLDEKAMEEVQSAIRRTMADEGAKRPTLAAPEPQRGQQNATDAGLLSRETTAAIGSTIDRLATTVRTQQPSLEDLARETLRPMLKSWLDENLPGVVERMVQVEIERVIRGR